MNHLKAVLLVMSLVASPAVAQNDSSEDFLKTVLAARVIDLNFVWDKNAPLLGFNPPYTIGLHTSHKDSTGLIPGGIAFAADMMFFSGQHGAPNLDALGHISHNGKLYGGLDAFSHEGSAGLTVLGIENYPKEKFINRGVLLDVARYKGVPALEPGYEITAADLEATAKAEGVEIRQGDSVLIRTGYGQFFDKDRAKFSGFRPGPGEEAAKWLASKRIFLTGDDQMSYEVVPEKGTIFPVHRTIIADNGIYLMENVNLEELGGTLAERKKFDFVLVVNPPRIKGATGAALNVFALLP